MISPRSPPATGAPSSPRISRRVPGIAAPTGSGFHCASTSRVTRMEVGRDGRLGGAVGVPNLGLREAVEQLCGGFRRERFAAEQKAPQHGEHRGVESPLDEAHRGEGRRGRKPRW